jgi:ubiquinone/menaquinone biosynthesis C-methylase UbiE
MLAAARRRAVDRDVANAEFARMDGERLELPDASFDVVLCALGLMFMPEPERAVREMRRVLRPGGRLVIAVWGDRAQCGWSTLFPIVDAEVTSDVCPLFFRMGQSDTLARVCREAQLEAIEQHRFATTLAYADAEEACSAAFVGGPVALAWSRFDAGARKRVRERYIESLSSWRQEKGYRVPGEFVVVSASAPDFR